MSQADQILFPFEHHTALGREDFMPAPCNHDALAWVERWPAWPANTLVLYGPAGCGKTHLASIWAKRAGARWLDRPLPAGARPEGVRAFVLDGLVRDGGIADEVGLLQFYNWLVEERGHLLLTAHTPVSAWPLDLPDLASRLRAAPAVAVGAPDEVLLSSLLVKLFADRQLRVPADVIRYMLQRMERSFAAARALVAALDLRALTERREINIRLVHDVFEQPDQQGPAPTPSP
jgi:chromosomal replication initiation ATPase DnaA